MQLIWSEDGARVPGAVDDDDLVDLYPWPSGRRWVRAMMVTTLDGGSAGPDGLSGSISGDADEAVFHAVRRLADAVLVGAGTVRAEGYGSPGSRPEDADRRAAAGQAPAPVLAIVSGSLDLPWRGALFAEAPVRPIVLTTADADPGRLEQARAVADVEVAEDDLDPSFVLATLERRGLTRIVCEGGPSLLAAITAAGLLDEADITLSPTFAGTGQSPRTPTLDPPAMLALRHVLTADGFVMNRYVRAGG